MVPFLFVDSRNHGFGLTWNWRRSGNPDIDGDDVSDDPYRPGDSDAAIIMGNNEVDSVSNFRKPFVSGHSRIGPFMESTILYGDGHSISRSVPQNYYIGVSPQSINSY